MKRDGVALVDAIRGGHGGIARTVYEGERRVDGPRVEEQGEGTEGMRNRGDGCRSKRVEGGVQGD